MVVEPKGQILNQRCRRGMGAPHSNNNKTTTKTAAELGGLLTERQERSPRFPKKTMSQRRKGKATVTGSLANILPECYHFYHYLCLR